MRIEIVLSILNLIVLAYLTLFKKYFEKKGENLATKEDIEEITKITEQSKIDFLKQIEEYKKELNLRYEFISLTKEYKVSLFQKTVKVRQNLIKWGNNQIPENLINDTINSIQEIILDLYSNAVLYKQYGKNHEHIQKEFNLLLTAIRVGQANGNFNYDPANLQDEFRKLQDELLK